MCNFLIKNKWQLRRTLVAASTPSPPTNSTNSSHLSSPNHQLLDADETSRKDEVRCIPWGRRSHQTSPSCWR